MTFSLVSVFVFLLYAVAVALILGTIIKIARGDSERKTRLALLEKALDSGAIDDATRRQLLQALATQRKGPGVLFMLGWVGLFVGLGMLVLGITDNDDWLTPAVLTTAVSFGVLSIPLAVREIQTRQEA